MQDTKYTIRTRNYEAKLKFTMKNLSIMYILLEVTIILVVLILVVIIPSCRVAKKESASNKMANNLTSDLRSSNKLQSRNS